MARDDDRELNLLDQYWNSDEVDRDQRFIELDAALRATVRGFEHADDAPEPEPEFVDRLWDELTDRSEADLERTTATSQLGHEAEEWKRPINPQPRHLPFPPKRSGT